MHEYREFEANLAVTRRAFDAARLVLSAIAGRDSSYKIITVAAKSATMMSAWGPAYAFPDELDPGELYPMELLSEIMQYSYKDHHPQAAAQHPMKLDMYWCYSPSKVAITRHGALDLAERLLEEQVAAIEAAPDISGAP